MEKMEPSSTFYKLAVLFMLKHSDSALANVQISEFMLNTLDANYLYLQQALSELTESGLTERQRIQNTSYYKITEEGIRTLEYFQEELPSAIQDSILSFLETTGYGKRALILCPSDCFSSENGQYRVHCQIFEEKTNLLDLTLTAPSEEAARHLCDTWALKSQRIYELIMEELL